MQEVVKQDGTVVRFIGLYLIRGANNSREGWGYKDMDETCGPYYFNCPLSYLDMTPAPDPVKYPHAAVWREKVRTYWAERNRKLAVGTRIKLNGAEFTVTDALGARGVYAKDLDGATWRIPRRHFPNLEVLT